MAFTSFSFWLCETRIDAGTGTRAAQALAIAIAVRNSQQFETIFEFLDGEFFERQILRLGFVLPILRFHIDFTSFLVQRSKTPLRAGFASQLPTVSSPSARN